MHIITIEVNENSALEVIRSLQKKKTLRVLDETIHDTPSLPGSGINKAEFISWIGKAEKSDSITLDNARAEWKKRRAELKRNII